MRRADKRKKKALNRTFSDYNYLDDTTKNYFSFSLYFKHNLNSLDLPQTS